MSITNGMDNFNFQDLQGLAEMVSGSKEDEDTYKVQYSGQTESMPCCFVFFYSLELPPLAYCMLAQWLCALFPVDDDYALQPKTASQLQRGMCVPCLPFETMCSAHHRHTLACLSACTEYGNHFSNNGHILEPTVRTGVFSLTISVLGICAHMPTL